MSRRSQGRQHCRCCGGGALVQATWGRMRASASRHWRGLERRLGRCRARPWTGIGPTNASLASQEAVPETGTNCEASTPDLKEREVPVPERGRGAKNRSRFVGKRLFRFGSSAKAAFRGGRQVSRPNGSANTNATPVAGSRRFVPCRRRSVVRPRSCVGRRAFRIRPTSAACARPSRRCCSSPSVAATAPAPKSPFFVCVIRRTARNHVRRDSFVLAGIVPVVSETWCWQPRHQYSARQRASLMTPVPGMPASGANEPVRPTPTQQRLGTLCLRPILLQEVCQAPALLKRHLISRHGRFPIFQLAGTIRGRRTHWMSLVRYQEVSCLPVFKRAIGRRGPAGRIPGTGCGPTCLTWRPGCPANRGRLTSCCGCSHLEL